MKILKSIALILVAMGAGLVFSLLAFLVIWIVIAGLFLFSRLSERARVFVEWSWLHFLLTIGLGVGIPYVLLILSAGF